MFRLKSFYVNELELVEMVSTSLKFNHLVLS